MNDKEIKEALALTAGDRYEYFIQCCAQYDEVWGLVVGEDGWLIFNDVDGDEIFPVWPTAEHANACCFDEHKQQQALPKAIKLRSFIDNCIPDMHREDILFGVFYDQDGEGLSVEAEMLKGSFEEELRPF